MTALTPAEYARATSWNLMIAGELLGKDFKDEGKERKWGSLHVCRQTGAWYDFAAATGGLSSIPLIKHLKKRAGEVWSSEDADKWLVKYLAEHPGTGQLEAEDDEWTQTRQAAYAELSRHYLEIKEPLDRGLCRGALPGLPRTSWTLSRGAWTRAERKAR